MRPLSYKSKVKVHTHIQMYTQEEGGRGRGGEREDTVLSERGRLIVVEKEERDNSQNKHGSSLRLCVCTGVCVYVCVCV